MDLKLEVVGLPVSSVDTALSFHNEQVGFTLDHDIQPGPGMRVVQLTPPGSSCSVVIGEGMPLGAPGSTKGLQLVVEDSGTSLEGMWVFDLTLAIFEHDQPLYDFIQEC